jgi:hypothetical protein
MVLKAAFHLLDADSISFAVSLCLASAHPVHDRAFFALEFSRNNLPNEAFAIIMSAPNIWSNFDSIDTIKDVIGSISQRLDTGSPSVKAAGLILQTIRSRKNNDAMEENPPSANRPRRSEYGFNTKLTGTSAQLRGEKTRLVFQKTNPPSQEELFSAAIIRGEDSILSSKIMNPIERENVFLNRWGDLWDTSGRIIRSSGKIPDPVTAAGSDIVEVPFLIHCCGGEFNTNLYHWLVEVFPSLSWRLEMTDEDIPVGVGDFARPWVFESLKLGAKGPITIVPVGDAILVRRLILLKLNKCSFAYPDSYKDTFSRVLERSDLIVGHRNQDPIYISRRDTRRRPLDNEIELEEVLRSIGVVPVVFTGLTLAEKIQTIRSAPLVVGAHGAGLSMLAFAETGRKVFEILPARLPLHKIHLCMAQISRMLGHEHHLYLENGLSIHGGMRWTANVPEIVAHIKKML